MREQDYHGYTLTQAPRRGILAKQIDGDDIKLFTCISKAKQYIDSKGSGNE